MSLGSILVLGLTTLPAIARRRLAFFDRRGSIELR
jgi:hypothetical protein